MTAFRFAPSPTGYLHPGNARTALLNALLARKQGGKLILRLDDTDTARVSEEYSAAIEEDLRWMGISADAVYRQSEREALYREAAEKLKAQGLLYACYDTPEELAYHRKRARAEGRPPVYDRAGLNLSAAQKAAFEQEGRQPHWRFRLSGEVVRFEDIMRGTQRIDTASLSDPVIIREDGRFLYALPSVADDADMAISHVIRGEDHVSNTAVQIELAQALGAKPPTFGHHSLLLDSDGGGFSKRAGGLSLRALRKAGAEPQALNHFLAMLGTSGQQEMTRNLDKLAERLDLSGLSRAPARFDTDQFMKQSAAWLHAMPCEEAKPRLAALGVRQDEAFWLAVRGNLNRIEEVKQWDSIIAGEMKPVIEDSDFIATALALLPPDTWDESIWSRWTKALAKESGRKGKNLFLPLRLALTGLKHGPEMKNLLYLMGRDEVVRRLGGKG